MLVDDDEGAAIARAQQRLGTMLHGKYRLDRVLGVGGMAAVYAATHRNGKEVAVKLLHPELSLNAEVRGRFVREGYAANAIKHRGAVDVLDDDNTEDGTAFLVMELLEGETLESLWVRGGCHLPVDAVAGLAQQTLEVLAAAHARGIVHRDVKPANLFLTRDGHLKVLDFGIARLRDVATSMSTRAGTTLGTPSFMAPEQAAGQTNLIDAQTDIWGLGATLFTLASGQLVHDGDNGQQIMIRAATTPARSLALALPGAPAWFVAVVDRALAFERAARWPSADAMREALRGGMARPTIPSQPSHPRLPEARGPVPSSPDSRPSARIVTQRLDLPLDTAEPVSMWSGSSVPVASRFPVQLVLAAGLSFAGVVVIGLLAIFLSRASSSTVAAPAPSIAPSIVPATSASTVSPPADVPVVVVEQLPPAASSTTASRSERPPPSAAAASSAVLTPPAPAVTMRPAAPPAPPAPAASARTGTAACTPPYEVDAQGHKKWKRECL